MPSALVELFSIFNGGPFPELSFLFSGTLCMKTKQTYIQGCARGACARMISRLLCVQQYVNQSYCC